MLLGTNKPADGTGVGTSGGKGPGGRTGPVGVGQLQHLAQGMQIVRSQMGGAPDACSVM